MSSALGPGADISYADAPKPLTQRERDFVKRIFSDWFEVPGEWKGSLRAYLESDPPQLGKAALGGGVVVLTEMAGNRAGVLAPLVVDFDLGDETLTPMYVNINGELLQVRVGPPGSGPDGSGRMLWVD